MAVLDHVVLSVTSPEVTMTTPRRVATMVVGRLSVTLPEGEEQVDGDERYADAYVYRPDGMPTGPFDFGFTRQDATVDMQAGISDFELNLDDAAARISGDVLFETEITADGLGDWRPGVDFRVGDRVWVRVWNKEILLPVTGITAVPAEEGFWRVRVGGKLVHDSRELAKATQSVRVELEAERRKRAEEAKRLAEQQERDRQLAQQAKDAADTADAAARSARSAASTANSTANRVSTLNGRVLDWTDSANSSMAATFDLSRAVSNLLVAISMINVSGLVNAPDAYNSRMRTAQSRSDDAFEKAWAGRIIDRT